MGKVRFVRAKQALPDAKVLHRLLAYDGSTGLFTWRSRGVAGWDKRWAGRPALACDWNGYKVGALLGKRTVGAHRIAYKYVHCVDPVEVDHINGDRSDNRISNLRSVTASENRRNGGIPRHNTSGIVGVRFRPERNKWHAYIGLGERSVNLGYFTDRSLAVAARIEAEMRYGFTENGRRTR